MKLSNGDEIVPVDKKQSDEIASLFKAYAGGSVRVGKDKYFLTSSYARWAEQYLNFQFRSTDIVILTYPKCGTTWTQEIVWTMINNPDLDNPAADDNLEGRVPFMEFDSLVASLTAKLGHSPVVVDILKKLAPEVNPDDGLFLEIAKNVKDIRIIKTHLPFSLLPKTLLDTCKVIYVYRNPKDQVCSYLHHHRIIKVHDYVGTNEQFVDYFCNGDLQYGNYAAHLAEAVARKSHPNLHTLSFEDLKHNNKEQLQRFNKFLGLSLSDKQFDNVMSKSTFSDMKKRMGKRLTENSDLVKKEQAKPNEKDPPKEGFYRKGETGTWRTDLTPELCAKIDNWTEENITKPLGMTFSYGK